MRSFQQRLAELDARGVRVAAVSVDPPETNREHRRKHGFTFPLLSDSSGETIRKYDLLHAAGGPGGADISRPAEFLIDPSGTVRWVNLTESAAVRTRPGEVLKAIDGIAK